MSETSDQPPVWTTVALSGEAMKVLAHPLRSRLLVALRTEGPATATSLAEALHTNSGATSYHLRRLAAVGLVEETQSQERPAVSATGRGRERWWRATTEMHSWNDEVAEGDPDAMAAARWLREAGYRMFLDAADEWLHNHDTWPIEWRRVSGASDYTIELTVDQFAALQEELTAVIRRHGAAAETANRAIETDTLTGARAESDDFLARPQQVFLYVNGFPKGHGPL